MIGAFDLELIMWTVPAGIGLILSAILWVAAGEDRRYIHLRGNGRRQLWVTNLFVNESLRVLIQLVMLAAGLASATLPPSPPPPPRYRLAARIIVWGVISIPWLTMAQSAVTLFYRRADARWQLRHPKEGQA